MINLSIVFAIVFLGTILSIPQAEAVSVSINLENDVYHYGDFLVFTIEVSEVTGDYAVLHIIDEAAKSSSAIPIPITEFQTTVPSPYPFESIVYPQGKYTLTIEYSGSSDSAEFELTDSGRIVIPFWIKELAQDWTSGKISNKEFALGIENLIDEKIIFIPDTNAENETLVKIPQWFKITTSWWANAMIPDSDYAKALEFLIKQKIIVV